MYGQHLVHTAVVIIIVVHNATDLIVNIHKNKNKLKMKFR